VLHHGPGPAVPLIERTSPFYNGLDSSFSPRRILDTTTNPSAMARIYRLHSPARAIERRQGGMNVDNGNEDRHSEVNDEGSRGRVGIWVFNAQVV